MREKEEHAYRRGIVRGMDVERIRKKIEIGWKADPKLTMTITNNVTKKDILLLTGFMIIVSVVIVGLNLLR